MRVLISLILSSYLFFSPLLGQAKKVKVDGQTVLGYIKVLADDSMEGRRSSLPGAVKASSYIADKFREWNIEPAGENKTYFQNFPLQDYFLVEPGASLEIINSVDRRSFIFDEGLHDEWRACEMSGSGNVEADIVFVRYGVHDPEGGYDDYQGVEVKDKIVFANSGWPKDLGDKNADAASYEKRVEAAQKLGAKGIIFFPEPSPIGQHTSYPAYVRLKKDVYKPDFVILGVNEKIGDYVFDYQETDLRDLFSENDRPFGPRSFNTGVRAKINLRTTFAEKRETRNVLAKISGMDGRLKNEYVIFGAHMDHLGITPRNEVLNGANDNASGTAVVMEIARLMRLNKVKPKRTIIFALWAAEEQGLLGSEYYVDHPLYPLDKTVVNINLDMVGQGKEKIGLGGIEVSSETWDALKTDLDPEIMKGINPRPGVGGSDHLSFLAKGVPALHMVGNPPHYKGHHPRDDWDLIKPDMLEKAGTFLYQAGLVLADKKADFFFAQRNEKILFRRETIINFSPLPVTGAIESMKDNVNPRIRIQLAYLEEDEKADPSRLKLGILDLLNALPDKIGKATGVSIYKESSGFRRSGSRGTRLVLGLKGTSSFRDNPAWLNIYGQLGIRYVLLEQNDLGFTDNKLDPAGKDILSSAQRAKVLLILAGLNDAQQQEVLRAAQKPLVFLSKEMPSPECIDLLKKGGHALALVCDEQEEPEAYFERLRQAKDKLGFDNLIAWNKASLWKDETQKKYLDLFSSFIKAGWTKPDLYERKEISKVLSETFINILRRYSADN